MKEHLTLLLLLVSTTICYAQETEKDSLHTPAKNALYFSIGAFGIQNNAFSFSYERYLFSTDKRFRVNYYARATGGKFDFDTDISPGDGPMGLIGLQGITGKTNHHFEVGLGVAVLYNSTGYSQDVWLASLDGKPQPNKSDYYNILPSTTIGYRYQKLNKGLIVRSGIATPDGIYVSLGLAF